MTKPIKEEQLYDIDGNRLKNSCILTLEKELEIFKQMKIEKKESD